MRATSVGGGHARDAGMAASYEIVLSTRGR